MKEEKLRTRWSFYGENALVVAVITVLVATIIALLSGSLGTLTFWSATRIALPIVMAIMLLIVEPLHVAKLRTEHLMMQRWVEDQRERATKAEAGLKQARAFIEEFRSPETVNKHLAGLREQLSVNLGAVRNTLQRANSCKVANAADVLEVIDELKSGRSAVLMSEEHIHQAWTLARSFGVPVSPLETYFPPVLAEGRNELPGQ